MRVTSKISLALLSAFATLCLVIWLALHQLVAPSFQRLENDKAMENFLRTENAINREIRDTQTFIFDYGEWDQAHDFMLGRNPEFIASELPHSVLVDSQFNVFVYFNPDRTIAGGAAIDLQTEEPAPLERYALSDDASWSPFPEGMHSKYAAQGLIESPLGLMAFATGPVKRTDASGAYAGHLLVGRLLDQNLIDTIQTQTRVAFRIAPARPPSPFESPAADARINTDAVSDVISLSKTLYGVDGAALATLVVDTPREISQIGARSLEVAFLFLTGASVICILLVNRSLQELVIRPVERLTRIMSSADAAPVVEDPGLERRKDEIGVLHQAFQDLFQRVDERTKQLAEAAAAAKEADRAKSQFLANMSHEIRTPMNGVIGMAQVLSNTDLNADQRGFVDVIGSSGDALLTIINDILDFSKIEAGQVQLNVAPFDLIDAIESIATLMAAKALEKNLELVVRIDPHLPATYMGDAGRVRQVVTNLVGNALKFTDRGHVLIDVSGKRVGGEADRLVQLHVRVEDTGRGVPAAKHSSIFEKFSQVDSSTTRNRDGAGLGLAISKSLIEFMGGEIGVESEVGKGSTFWFTATLPTQDGAAARPAAPADCAGARMLVVDDSAVVRRTLQEWIAAHGFFCRSCASGDEAFGLLKASAKTAAPFDIVILDHDAFGANGVEAAKLIRADADVGRTPIIMLTPVNHSDADALFSSLAISRRLTKPVKLSILLQMLAETLRENSPGDAGADGRDAAKTPSAGAPSA